MPWKWDATVSEDFDYGDYDDDDDDDDDIFGTG